ncbi:uncharacterized protein LOC118001903 isoform X2 [Mirounga leonina]|uniref:uncharacterized protein LOC118001781 isoform X1 n=1 Tax=Mirounga leonina TaxID=9715 RepID=UPI00156C2558|nr:uncharacterized protein LOC118001781 isoform X1 [Mirounga leonina]XP_034847818.1 uncharacterized protein LOC118001781 isoform X2 [Mirounga leonina]XP_034847979.1 uncharacterized protein LOC118001903 isoform X1 [Mirounga leonina]XP_034847980.1 uncharacterized protein LOC118001903 isoform X2 [Mirounga leonina]
MSTPRPWAAPKTRKTRRMVNASQREELTHDRGGPSGYIQRKLQTRVSSLESTVCPPQTQEGSQQPFPRGFLPRLTEWRGTWEQQDATERGARGQDKNKIICKPDEKDPRSEAYLRRLHQMYSASLANMDFSRRLLERNGWFADVDPEGRAGDLLDYLIPSGHGLCGVWPGPRGRRTGDVGPPGQHGPPPTALPTLCFLKGDSPAGKTEDPNRKTRGHRAARCGMIKLPEHKRGEPAPPRMTTVPLT